MRTGGHRLPEWLTVPDQLSRAGDRGALNGDMRLAFDDRLSHQRLLPRLTVDRDVG